MRKHRWSDPPLMMNTLHGVMSATYRCAKNANALSLQASKYREGLEARVAALEAVIADQKAEQS